MGTVCQGTGKITGNDRQWTIGNKFSQRRKEKLLIAPSRLCGKYFSYNLFAKNDQQPKAHVFSTAKNGRNAIFANPNQTK